MVDTGYKLTSLPRTPAKQADSRIEPFVKLRSADNESPRLVYTNIAWIMVEKGIAICDAFFVGALVARYLGPTQLGYITFAYAIMALATPLALLGLDRVAVRNFARDTSFENGMGQSKVGEYFWSLVIARLVSGCTLFLAINVSLHFGLFGDRYNDETNVLRYTSLSLLILPFTVPMLILEARLLTKWAVWIGTFWLAVSSVARCLLVVESASVESFVLATQLVSVATAMTLIIVVKRAGLFPSFRFPGHAHFSSLLLECWPLAISSLAIAMYMSLDVTMLRWMKGPAAAGTYSVAVMMSSLWHFLPMAIGASYLPTLARSQLLDTGAYIGKIKNFVDLNVDVALVCLVVSLVFCPPIIRLLFGPAYAESIPIFQIHAFSLLFVFAGVARSQYLLVEGLHTIALITTCLGVVVNVIANLLLIPRFGGHGAAAATLMAYLVAGHASSFFFPRVRAFGCRVHMSALAAPYRLVGLVGQLWRTAQPH